MENINLLAVLLSAVTAMVIGSLWYGPIFGKEFIKASGMSDWSPEKKAAAKKAMAATYTAQFVASLITFYVLAHFINGMGELSVKDGLTTAFWAWLGFAVPVQLGNSIWGGNMKLFWLGIGNHLVTLLAAAAIIGAMG